MTDHGLHFNEFDFKYVDRVVWVGVTCFIGAIICNIIYYFIHPSHVTAGNFKDKLTFYVCGKPCGGRRTSVAGGDSLQSDEAAIQLKSVKNGNLHVWYKYMFFYVYQIKIKKSDKILR